MGNIAHDAIVMVTSESRPGGLPDIEAFRASLPPAFRPLVVGPVRSAVNGYASYAFLPDGSKEGWEDSDTGDRHRDRFVALFSTRFDDGSSHDQGVSVRFGGDYAHQSQPRVTYFVGGETR